MVASIVYIYDGSRTFNKKISVNACLFRINSYPKYEENSIVVKYSNGEIENFVYERYIVSEGIKAPEFEEFCLSGNREDQILKVLDSIDDKYKAAQSQIALFLKERTHELIMTT